MEASLLWLFLFIALSIGWLLGYHARNRKGDDSPNYSSPHNIKHRLQLLFDSYSDESIDRFVHSLDVNPETLSTHISIGKHFRAQGEVEKAILIHQNLMAHPELSDVASESIIYELAQDYKAAGLFDRAESLLEQLGDSRQFRFKSTALLLDIYEHEREWQNAVDKGFEVELKKHPNIALRVAQYCCEIAEEKLSLSLFREAVSFFRQALSIHKSCTRALLGLARIYIKQEDFSSSLSCIKQLAEISPESIVMALPMLLECTRETNSFEQHQAYLEKLLNETGQVPIMLAIVESMVAQGEQENACRFLLAQIKSSPSISALDAFFELNPVERHLDADISDVMVKIVGRINKERSLFRCGQCGFSGNQLHWMCPSCKGWQTIKPQVEYVHSS